jgi:hypothetical protein
MHCCRTVAIMTIGPQCPTVVVLHRTMTITHARSMFQVRSTAHLRACVHTPTHSLEKSPLTTHVTLDFASLGVQEEAFRAFGTTWATFLHGPTCTTMYPTTLTMIHCTIATRRAVWPSSWPVCPSIPCGPRPCRCNRPSCRENCRAITS